MNCQVNDSRDARGFRVVQLQNQLLSLTIYPERGAEIRSLVNLKNDIDVLWKAPWHPSQAWNGDTEPLWMDGYAGGWQNIFPNGGNPCIYKGAPLGFHGEASVARWHCEVKRSAGWIAAHLSVNLARSPFHLRRTVVIEDGSPRVRVQECLSNEGEEEMHFMWGEHPAYGAPFLSEHTELTVPAAQYLREGIMKPESWPGKMSVPSERERLFAMGYLAQLESGRYDLKNRQLGFGVQWNWDAAVFPYVWLWQELRGSFGYPWHGRCYVMGVEPFTSIPGNGLLSVIDAGTAKVIGAGATLVTEFSVTLIDY